MTVVILLLECFSERPTDVLVSLHYVLLLYFNLHVTMISVLFRTCMCLNAVRHWFIKLLFDQV